MDPCRLSEPAAPAHVRRLCHRCERRGRRRGVGARADHARRWARLSGARRASPIGARSQGYRPLSRSLLGAGLRSEEHTSELQSLMRISYAVFCLKKKNKIRAYTVNHYTETQLYNNI